MSSSMIYTPNNSITIVVDGKIYSAGADHPNFEQIVHVATKLRDYDEAVELINLELAVVRYSNGLVKICGDDVYVNDILVHNTITDRIIKMMDERQPFTALVNFLVNLMQNPSAIAITELYSFLDVGKMPITPDGHFLAYKKVRNDYHDIWSGTMNNRPGSIVEMDRYAVNPDRNQTCSTGLHFCSKEYLNNYGTNVSNARVVIVKINPKDVVSIPADYNNTKGRCCRYAVLQEMLPDNNEMDRSVVTMDITRTSSEGYDIGYKDGRAHKRKQVTKYQHNTSFEEGYLRGYRDGRYGIFQK